MAVDGSGILAGGVTPPLYAPLLAFTNDALQLQICPLHLGLVFTSGLGAIRVPLRRLAMYKSSPYAF
jgi:hypothetical protein